MMLAHSSYRMRFTVLVWAVVLALEVTNGCHTKDYRLAADHQAYDLVKEKSNDPRWEIGKWSVYTHPDSRYYDVYDPDKPPMPPDDPASHRYMVEVDGMKGWKHWNEWGSRSMLENPKWRQELVTYARFNKQDEVVLDMDSALQLSLMNSPDYQTQLETLYLSALDVSTERFRFEVQFFGGNGTSFVHLGEGFSEGLASNRGSGLGGARNRGPGESNTLLTATDAWFQKRTATAGQVLVGFANSFVWQFAGPDSDNTVSLLNFNLVQPLLRGAGRGVALEQLTIVERSLLANLRAFQRYRQGFYTRIAVGDLGVVGPQRRGGFFGGTGLTGFTGTGSGGLGGVGSATGFGRAGFSASAFGGAGGGGAGFAGGGAGVIGGFLGLLQQLQQLRNTEDSLALQVNQLAQLVAYQKAGLITLIQVDNLRQNIETERANLLQAHNAFESTLDSYKTSTMGLPPDLPMALDDSLIKQFRFLDPAITQLSRHLAQLRSSVGDLPPQPTVPQLKQAIAKVRELQASLRQQFHVIDHDYVILDQRTPARESRMTAEQRQTFREEMAQERDKLVEVKARFEKYAQLLDELEKNVNDQTRAQSLVTLVGWMGDFDRLIEEASLVQARARLESVTLETVHLQPERALMIARTNRLDIMNNRAALVDSWRLIAFNANALKSNLSISFHGDMSTRGNNPVKFRAPTGSLSASVQFDPPLTRLLERNNYRQSLIDYERDRRQYIQFIDSVHLSLRNLLRSLQQLETNLEIQRRAVAIAIRRVDLTRENLSQPKPPPAPGEPRAQFGDTAALDLLTALSDLRSTQNNFMSVWLNYYATRMVLERDLGLMDVDPQGRWIDRPIPELNAERLEELEVPPPVPQQVFEQVNAIRMHVD